VKLFLGAIFAHYCISNNFKKDHKVTIINLGLMVEGDNRHYVLIKHLSILYTKIRQRNLIYVIIV